MLFDGMAKVSAEIKVSVSHGFYGLIDETIEFMHAGSRLGYFFHKSVKCSLSTYPII